ncbi:hypothetical protein Pmi06nite_04820 [Planotetraspora mira]|uniref:Uncharacterized protein n=1 Tax=Planotetraspora mira TaxID=58121 RepID=A0A8J3TH60_9ACTN|nr:hypothetical protein Pmi06nite_04820 [Planotetraspora mira]
MGSSAEAGTPAANVARLMAVEAIAAKVVARTTLLALLRMVLPFGRGASLRVTPEASCGRSGVASPHAT